jgi:hypothetical protein
LHFYQIPSSKWHVVLGLKSIIMESFYIENWKYVSRTSDYFIKTCIRPILCYDIETWFDCAATLRRKIQIVQEKQLKIILNRYWRHFTAALHEEACVPLIENFGRKITENFFQKSVFWKPFDDGTNDPQTIASWIAQAGFWWAKN